jgi:ketosteroid isomerase-like protein
MTRTPLETVKGYYASLAPGRRQNLMELLHPDVVLEIQDGMPGTRPCYVGMKAYVEEFLFDLYGEFELDLVPEEFFQAGRHVVALGRQKGRAVRSGLAYDVRFSHVWSVTDGKVTHARMFADTAVLRDAVLGLPAL